MKFKALIFGLLIAGTSAITYTSTKEDKADYAQTKIDPRKITKIPTHG